MDFIQKYQTLIVFCLSLLGCLVSFVFVAWASKFFAKRKELEATTAKLDELAQKVIDTNSAMRQEQVLIRKDLDAMPSKTEIAEVRQDMADLHAQMTSISPQLNQLHNTINILLENELRGARKNGD